MYSPQEGSMVDYLRHITVQPPATITAAESPIIVISVIWAAYSIINITDSGNFATVLEQQVEINLNIAISSDPC